MKNWNATHVEWGSVNRTGVSLFWKFQRWLNLPYGLNKNEKWFLMIFVVNSAVWSNIYDFFFNDFSSLSHIIHPVDRYILNSTTHCNAPWGRNFTDLMKVIGIKTWLFCLKGSTRIAISFKGESQRGVFVQPYRKRMNSARVSLLI